MSVASVSDTVYSIQYKQKWKRPKATKKNEDKRDAGIITRGPHKKMLYSENIYFFNNENVTNLANSFSSSSFVWFEAMLTRPYNSCQKMFYKYILI